MSPRTALRPSFLTMPAMSKPVPTPATEENLLAEEKTLHSLYEHSGWKVLSNYIDEICQQMDEVNIQAMNNGAKFDEIGQNTVVINLTRSIISRIKSKVSDAYEAIEKTNER